MPDSKPELVTCPACGKSYRWKQSAVGKVVPCRKCDAEFIVPKHPGVGQRIEPEEANSEDSVYALALDLEDEPAASPPPPSTAEQPSPGYQPPAPAIDTSGPGELSETDAITHAEEPAEVSEAVKAQRREEQRKAAAAEATGSMQKYKTPILLIAGIGIVIVILLVLLFVSDALDGILG